MAAAVVGGELAAEAVKVGEDAVVNDADQAVEFEQGVLQRGGGEQDFGVDVGHRLFEGAGGDVAAFVHVAQAVRFVQYRQIPVDAPDVVRLAFGERVGADDGIFLLEGVGLVFAQDVVVFAFEDDAAEAEFVLQFLVPLFAQVGGGDDEDFVPPLCPTLRDDQPRFDGFAEADFVGKDDAARERVAAGEQCGIDLVRVEVYLGIDQCRGEGFDAVAGGAAGQLPGEVLALLWGDGGSFMRVVAAGIRARGRRFPLRRVSAGRRFDAGDDKITEGIALSVVGVDVTGQAGIAPSKRDNDAFRFAAACRVMADGKRAFRRITRHPLAACGHFLQAANLTNTATLCRISQASQSPVRCCPPRRTRGCLQFRPPSSAGRNPQRSGSVRRVCAAGTHPTS